MEDINAEIERLMAEASKLLRQSLELNKAEKAGLITHSEAMHLCRDLNDNAVELTKIALKLARSDEHGEPRSKAARQ